MPPTKGGHQNSSGVSRRTPNGVFYEDGKYLCQRLINGTPCNREMTGKAHNISSHNSKFHAGNRYQQLQAQGQYKCMVCDHESSTFNAIQRHVRHRHQMKGSSDTLKLHYGIPIRTRGNSNELVGNGYENTPQEAQIQHGNTTQVAIEVEASLDGPAGAPHGLQSAFGGPPSNTAGAINSYGYLTIASPSHPVEATYTGGLVESSQPVGGGAAPVNTSQSIDKSKISPDDITYPLSEAGFLCLPRN